MGLLHALEAPSYQKFFLPDAFLLRGLILKDLCHFIPAKRVVRAFRFRYQRPLDDAASPSADGEDRGHPRGRRRRRATIGRRTAFLRSLEQERRVLDDYDADLGGRRARRAPATRSTTWRCASSCGYGVSSSRRPPTASCARAARDRGAGEPARLRGGPRHFQASEGRGGPPHGRGEALVVPYDSANVYYEFDTEYWNDELHSYQYFVTSRCFEPGRCKMKRSDGRCYWTLCHEPRRGSRSRRSSAPLPSIPKGRRATSRSSSPSCRATSTRSITRSQVTKDLIKRSPDAPYLADLLLPARRAVRREVALRLRPHHGAAAGGAA